jgi:hypothetical protein
MRPLTGSDFPAFVTAKPAAAVLFDAEWDVRGRPAIRGRMLEAERVLGDRVNFAEVDIDRDGQLAKSIPVLNVPLVAYYRDGKLVAVLIGADQDVRARAERVLRGEPIGYKDGTTTTQNAPAPRPAGRRSLKAFLRELLGRGPGR